MSRNRCLSTRLTKAPRCMPGLTQPSRSSANHCIADRNPADMQRGRELVLANVGPRREHKLEDLAPQVGGAPREH